VDTESAVDQVRSIGSHEGTLRDIVHALKYDGRRSLAATLARLMSAAAPAFIADADAVVPVPLHPARRRARGFNQASDLARTLGPPVVHALRRTRATSSQTTLPSDKRHVNVDGAFAPTRHLRRLAGCTVLLVDDVRTTGATLDACAKVLKAERVARVWAITAARVATPRV
jgi:ComF family protein